MTKSHSSVLIYAIGERPSGFVGYQQIARPVGLSVAALKKHLAAAGLLIDADATEKALAEGFAIRAALPEDAAYPNPKGYRVMWARKKTLEFLSSIGADSNAGYGIHNGFSASDQLQKAGRELFKSPNLSRGLKDRIDELMNEAHFPIINARCDPACGKEARAYFALAVAPIVDFFEKKKSLTDDEKSALRRLTEVRTWIAPRRTRAAAATAFPSPSSASRA